MLRPGNLPSLDIDDDDEEVLTDFFVLVFCGTGGAVFDEDSPVMFEARLLCRKILSILNIFNFIDDFHCKNT